MNKFEQFAKLFKEYNSHTNLMSKNDAEMLETKHIPDCLAISKFFEKYSVPKTLLDIGTGGGLPAIPIALSFPTIDVTATDSIGKKIKFIENVKKELSIDGLHPVCKRVENLKNKGVFDVVTTRAVASLSTILEYSAPFAKINGYIVAYKSKTADEELLAAQNAIKILKLKFIEKIDVSNSQNDDVERYLLVFQKIDKTPSVYPRQNNLARKNPL